MSMDHPLAGHVALSIDGVYSAADQTVTAGMILRRTDESVIFAVYRFLFNNNDVLEFEIHVLMHGMALTLQH